MNPLKLLHMVYFNESNAAFGTIGKKFALYNDMTLFLVCVTDNSKYVCQPLLVP